MEWDGMEWMDGWTELLLLYQDYDNKRRGSSYFSSLWSALAFADKGRKATCTPAGCWLPGMALLSREDPVHRKMMLQPCGSRDESVRHPPTHPTPPLLQLMALIHR